MFSLLKIKEYLFDINILWNIYFFKGWCNSNLKSLEIIKIHLKRKLCFIKHQRHLQDMFTLHIFLLASVDFYIPIICSNWDFQCIQFVETSWNKLKKYFISKLVLTFHCSNKLFLWHQFCLIFRTNYHNCSNRHIQQNYFSCLFVINIEANF